MLLSSLSLGHRPDQTWSWLPGVGAPGGPWVRRGPQEPSGGPALAARPHLPAQHLWGHSAHSDPQVPFLSSLTPAVPLSFLPVTPSFTPPHLAPACSEVWAAWDFKTVSQSTALQTSSSPWSLKAPWPCPGCKAVHTVLTASAARLPGCVTPWRF